MDSNKDISDDSPNSHDSSPLKRVPILSVLKWVLPITLFVLSACDVLTSWQLHGIAPTESTETRDLLSQRALWLAGFGLLIAGGILSVEALVSVNDTRQKALEHQKHEARARQTKAAITEAERKQALAEKRQKDAEDEREQLKKELAGTQQELSTTQQALSETAQRQAVTEDRVRGRQFNRDKLITLVGLLGQHSINMRFVGGDPETESLAHSIAKAFIEAGWTVAGMALMMGISFRGIRVRFKDQQSAPAFADGVFDALTKSGLEVQAAFDQNLAPSEMEIVVGHR